MHLVITSDTAPPPSLYARLQVLATLDGACALNLRILRVWLFNDGPDAWNSLQPSPGVLSERVLQGFDWLLIEAGRRGLQLLPCLTNYWPDYGGMPQYVRWSTQGCSSDPDVFYSDDKCIAWFRGYLTALLTRVRCASSVWM